MSSVCFRRRYQVFDSGVKTAQSWDNDPLGAYRTQAMVYTIDPTVSDMSLCAYVVDTSSSGVSQFANMSAEDGAIYSAGIVGCWIVAYFLRTVFSVIKGSMQNEVE